MAIRKHLTGLACLIAVTCVAILLSGCNRGDLSEYRPAREHSAKAAGTQSQEAPSPDERSVATEPAEPADSTASNAEMSMNDVEFLPVSALVPVNMIDGANIRALMSIPASDSASGSRPPSTVVDGNPVVAAPAEPRKIELLVKDKVFQTEPKTRAVRLSFDDLDLLKVLNMDPVVENAVELMPDWLRAVDGKAVRIRGFMYPTYEAEGIEHFVLARDNQICCFGRDPKIYDLVQVDMKDGKTTNYIPPTRAFDVVGKLKIEMQAQDGKPYGLYSIEQAEVIDR